MSAATVPYENATSGAAARDEVTKLLRRFGCDSVGFMDLFDEHAVLLGFKHRGRPIQLKASAKGWAQMYLKVHPWTSRMRATRQEHEARALKQGLIAVNSILRDWVKGSVTAVECGVMSIDAMFLPHFVTPNGQAVLQIVTSSNLLPPPKE